MSTFLHCSLQRCPPRLQRPWWWKVRITNLGWWNFGLNISWLHQPNGFVKACNNPCALAMELLYFSLAQIHRYWISVLVNSLAPGGCPKILTKNIYKCNFFSGEACDFLMKPVLMNANVLMSTLVQVMAWCHQAKCWPRSLSPFWLNETCKVGNFPGFLEYPWNNWPQFLLPHSSLIPWWRVTWWGCIVIYL